MKILLLHGWQSAPGGVKPTFLSAVKPGTVILHSRADDVVAFADSEELVENSGLSDALTVVGSDHRLADPQSLEAMLQACERHRQH